MKIAFCVLLFIALNAPMKAQIATLTLVCAKSPTIDGIVSAGEWEDSDTVRLAVGFNKSVRISFKRDLAKMYFLFSGHLESQIKLPEILIDVNNDKSSAWQTDDWWFHISANDCEHSGAYGVYTNCQLVQPNWEAENNITQGQPFTDTVEVSIPFAKIGFIESETNYRFGLCFFLNGFGGGNSIWPPDADKLAPSTWGDMLLESLFCNPTGLRLAKSTPAFLLYPNPSPNLFSLSFNDIIIESYRFEITDLMGNLLPFESTRTSNKIEFELNKKPGVYFLHIRKANELIQTHKILIH